MQSPDPRPGQGPGGEGPRFEPFVNPLPWGVVALFLPILAVEIVLSLAGRGILGGPAGIGWRLDAVRDYGFFIQVFDWMRASGEWPAEYLIRFVTYPFVHGAFTSALFSAVMLLALGKWVGEAIGSVAVIAIFVVSGIFGAAVLGLLSTEEYPLVGAFPPVYGLIGGFTWVLWVQLGSVGENQMRAFTLIGFLMALQLIFGLLFGGTQQWIADIAGFAAGFALAPVVTPGGFHALVRRLRRG